MCEADQSICIDDRDERHAPPLEDVDLLLVPLGNGMARIRKTDERNMLRIPVGTERHFRVRPDRHHIGPATGEVAVAIAQAR